MLFSVDKGVAFRGRIQDNKLLLEERKIGCDGNLTEG